MYIDTSTVYFNNEILYSYKYFNDDLIATVLFVFIDGAVFLLCKRCELSSNRVVPYSYEHV